MRENKGQNQLSRFAVTRPLKMRVSVHGVGNHAPSQWSLGRANFFLGASQSDFTTIKLLDVAT